MKGYKQLGILALTTGSIFITSAGHTDDLTASSEDPTVFFTDTTGVDTTPFSIFSSGGTGLAIADNIGTNTHNIIDMRGAVDSTDNEKSLDISSNGDISFANDAVFINRSENHLGIGTTEPVSDIHVVGNSNDGTSIRLEYPDTTNQIWDLGVGPTDFIISRNDNGFPITVLSLSKDAPANSIRATDVGIGIGTNAPVAKLDVRGDINATFDGTNSDSLQRLLVMSANNANSANRSDAGFVLENARENFSWTFRTLEDVDGVEGTTGLAISKQGTGGRELLLVNNTDNDATKVGLFLGNGAKNDTGSWDTASSRSYKKNIHDLSSEDAMQTLRGLKSVQYQYKSTNAKKIGFIAEDVPELVSNKDRKSLDPMQIVAVLTKAVQEQDKSLLSKDKKIAEMEVRAEKNTSRLEKIEAQLIKLMMK